MTSSGGMVGVTQICVALGLLALMCGAGVATSVDLDQEETAPNFVCDACLQFSTEAQMILSDPETQRQAIDLVTQMACQSLTPKLQMKCVDMVTAYVSDAFTALQVYLGPEICAETGLCNVESTRQTDPRGKLLGQTDWANARTCALCEDFAKDALSYLATNTTKLQIIGALHLACARLEDLSKQCDLLVDMYAPDLIEHLDDLSPDELCAITHLCKPVRKPVLARRGLKRNDCAICQFVVLELKLKLRDPLTQEKLLEVLLNGCDRVTNHVDECKMIVEQYAPFILANLDTILDADALCARIGACRTQKRDPFESGLVLPSEGRAHHRVHAL